MIHSYPQDYFDLYQIAMGENYTFRQWNNAVNVMANRFNDLNVRNKFKGDMLEVFSEIFFALFQNDPSFGLTDYTPIAIDDDYGVDAVGTNANGHACVVQVKYRSNPLDVITYESIAKTYTAAILHLHKNDVFNYDNTVFLFTNSNSVSISFEKVMAKKAVVINRGVISTMVDNNSNFWSAAYNLIFATLDT